MKILVTGSAGMVGSQVTRLLRGSGHEAVGFDLAEGADIMDAAALERAAAGCDAVVHAAAVVDEEQAGPVTTMAVNLQGTWNALQAARAAGAQRVVHFSSVNALGCFMGLAPPAYLPIDDDHPCCPRSVYGQAKHLSEVMCEHFTATTGISTVCLRPPAIWGDEAYGWVAAKRREDPAFEWSPVWEYGAFCDVRDVARAVLCALTCDDPGHVRALLCAEDISTSSAQTARELAQQLLPEVPWRGGDEHEADPFCALVLTGNARRRLGWRPRHTWRGWVAAHGG